MTGLQPFLIQEAEREFRNTNIYLKEVHWNPQSENQLAVVGSDKTVYFYTPLLFPQQSTEGLLTTTLDGPMCTLRAPESIFQTQWYPKQNTLKDSTSSLFVLCKSQPIQLWSVAQFNKEPLTKKSKTVSLDTVFSPVDHAFEFKQCYSFAATRYYVVAGSRKVLHIFDINRPDRQLSMYRISGSRGFGLNGLVSAVNTKSFEDPHFYGAGTTSGVVGLWDIREPYTQSLHLNAKELHNNAAAVTQITWSNALTHMVVVGYRQHDLLHCWDERFPKYPVMCFPRRAVTGQKLAFQFVTMNVENKEKEYLLSGNSFGTTLCYDPCTGNCLEEWPFHDSPQTSLAVHPRASTIVATCSGTRQFPAFDDAFETDDCCKLEIAMRPKTCVRVWQLKPSRS